MYGGRSADGTREPSKETDALAHKVIGAAIEVHRILGPGYLESVYEDALCIELELNGIPFKRQVGFGVEYKRRTVGEGRLDLLVDDRLIVELKPVEDLLAVHRAQVIWYLKATGCEIGLFVNFNVAILKDGVKRVVFS